MWAFQSYSIGKGKDQIECDVSFQKEVGILLTHSFNPYFNVITDSDLEDTGPVGLLSKTQLNPGIKTNNWQIESYKTKDILVSKGNNWVKKEETHRVGQTLCPLCIW